MGRESGDGSFVLTTQSILNDELARISGRLAGASPRGVRVGAGGSLLRGLRRGGRKLKVEVEGRKAASVQCFSINQLPCELGLLH